MSEGLSRRALGGSALAVVGTFGILRHARGEAPLHIRCSLDTAPTHVRNVSITDYLAKVEKASGGRITSQVFSSGQLFPDLHVANALIQGQVEMAAPGTWVLTGIVPDCDFPQLPMFYGMPLSTTHKATDGKAGAYVNAQIQKKLRVQVIGPWIDLGYQNWYTTKVPLHTSADIKGLKIRSPGGAGISWRIRFFGGIPNVTAWPDVPLALSQGTFDGFVSTNESVASAKLWEAGVKYSYQDRQYVGQYLPMITNQFWSKLTPDLKKIMTSVWAENIATYRANAARDQDNARKEMASKGVQFTDPSDAVLAKARAAMIKDEATLVKAAHLSAEVVKLAHASA